MMKNCEIIPFGRSQVYLGKRQFIAGHYGLGTHRRNVHNENVITSEPCSVHPKGHKWGMVIVSDDEVYVQLTARTKSELLDILNDKRVVEDDE